MADVKEPRLGSKLKVRLNDGTIDEVKVISKGTSGMKLIHVGIEYSDGYRHPVLWDQLQKAIVCRD